MVEDKVITKYMIVFMLCLCYVEAVLQTQSLIQDLNLGSNMNVSSRWSFTNVKKSWRQISLLYSVLCLV